MPAVEMSPAARHGSGASRDAVCVFAPGILLTITVEDAGGADEVHLHAGGQGYWVARSLVRLGARSMLCAPVGGEEGEVLVSLISGSGVELVGVPQTATSPCYVHDRRGGERVTVARTPAPTVDRHAADELFSLTLASAVDCGMCVLTGNRDTGAVSEAFYRRLAHDLDTLRVPVVADLHGPELHILLHEAAPALIRVSEDDLLADRAGGGETEGTALTETILALVSSGASERLVVSRGPAQPSLAVMDGAWFRIAFPRLDAVDWRGAGDAMTAALALGLRRGLEPPELLRRAAATGAASVTRRGLASVDQALVDALATQVRVDLVAGLEEALGP
jgi:1-phosphofructokinase